MSLEKPANDTNNKVIEGGGVEFYTRGGVDAPDTRGNALVALHAEKVQKEKEERAMHKLQQLLPHLSATTHAVALQECNWEEDRALALLRIFASAKGKDLKKLQKEKKKRIEEMVKRKKKRNRSRKSDDDEDKNNSSGSNDSATDDDDSEEEERRRKKRKKKKESKDKKKKDRKRQKRRKNSSPSGSSGSETENEGRNKNSKKKKKEYEYGKFGVLRETDYYNKRPEFTLWALEVKGADLETMSRFEEKELFKTFMEDYNTATLPHDKYYSLETYEKTTGGGTGTGGTGGQERMVFNDEAERKRELKAQREREHADRLRQAYEEMKTTDKAAAMREQELLRAKMALAYRTGNTKEAARLAERLKPDTL